MNLDMKWGLKKIPLRGAQGEGSQTRLFEFFCPRTLAQNLGCTFDLSSLFSLFLSAYGLTYSIILFTAGMKAVVPLFYFL